MRSNVKMATYSAITHKPLDEFTMWHNRLGHAGSGRIAAIMDEKWTPTKTHTCNACMKGKLSCLPFKNHFKAADAPLSIVHGDLVGPITPATNGGARYFLTLVDQFSGYIHVEILKEKSEATKAIEDF